MDKFGSGTFIYYSECSWPFTYYYSHYDNEHKLGWFVDKERNNPSKKFWGNIWDDGDATRFVNSLRKIKLS